MLTLSLSAPDRAAPAEIGGGARALYLDVTGPGGTDPAFDLKRLRCVSLTAWQF
ncbi:hypothetical protein ABT120_48905 [Nonomuraea angiospora]|uniref:hypothetical protein n=1 Tax=Nonomuraea angiospora TaxID=46172 RepID=UPI00332BF9A2